MTYARTFNVPVEHKDGTRAIEPRPYKPFVMTIGGRKIRFAIQEGGTVAHYASGYRLGNVNPVKVERMARISHHTRTTDRQAGIITIMRIVNNVGEAAFLARIDGVPVINSP